MQKNQRVLTGFYGNLIENIGMIAMECLALGFQGIIYIKASSFGLDCATNRKTTLFSNEQRLLFFLGMHRCRKNE
ncbi:Uncharacterised protein [Mycobacterium tuberculosis]|nr:Uncharacterised protein [Mycobacterium tuberculosis]